MPAVQGLGDCRRLRGSVSAGGRPRDCHSPACRVPCSGASGSPGSDRLTRRAGARGPRARARAWARRDRHRLGRAVAASARRLGGAQGRRSARRHGLHVPPAGPLDDAERAGRGRRRHRGRRPSLRVHPPASARRRTGPIRSGCPLCLDGPLRPVEGGPRHRRGPPEAERVPGSGAGRRQRSGRPGGRASRWAGLVRQERQPAASRSWFVVRARQRRDERAAAGQRCSRRRSMRCMPPVPRRLPDRGHRRSGRDRRRSLLGLAGPGARDVPAGPSRGARRSHLRLRRLPGGLPAQPAGRRGPGRRSLGAGFGNRWRHAGPRRARRLCRGASRLGRQPSGRGVGVAARAARRRRRHAARRSRALVHRRARSEVAAPERAARGRQHGRPRGPRSGGRAGAVPGRP